MRSDVDIQNGKVDGPDSIKFTRLFCDRGSQEFTAKRGEAGAAPAAESKSEPQPQSELQPQQ